MLGVVFTFGATCISVHLYTISYVQMAGQYIYVHVCYWSLHVCYPIGYMCIDCGMHIYVDIAKLWITSVLLILSCNMPTRCVRCFLQVRDGMWFPKEEVPDNSAQNPATYPINTT